MSLYSEESNISDVTRPESSPTSDTEKTLLDDLSPLDNSTEESQITVYQALTKPCEATEKPLLNSDEECVRKFTMGEPIIDQRNPFKTTNIDHDVSEKYSQYQREPQLQRENYKNALNSLHKSPSDDFISTEEVLRQSKYVQTYIKNPDPYFVYDPAVLEAIKDDELLKIKAITNSKKLLEQQQQQETLKGLKKKSMAEKLAKEKPKQATYKKCSKPNYPDLSDIKVRVGTETDGSYLNPTEVKTNVRKFDECVKKIQFSSDDDLEDMEGPLTKSNSSEESTANIQNETHSKKAASKESLFTSTVKSKDFQKYLEKNGLILAPQKPVLKVRSAYTMPSKPVNKVGNQKSPALIQPSNQRPNAVSNGNTNGDTPKKLKRSSIFQRLLSNNIFATRRRTMPKETVPMTRKVYDSQSVLQESSCAKDKSSQPKKRIVLQRKEKQSGRSPRSASKKLNGAISVARDGSCSSISSALSNAENADELDSCYPPKSAQLSPSKSWRFTNGCANTSPMQNSALPSNRNLQNNIQQKVINAKNIEPCEANVVTYTTIPIVVRSTPNNNVTPSIVPKSPQPTASILRRAPERRSLEPTRRLPNADKQPIFARTASMDRSEILKRSGIPKMMSAKTIPDTMQPRIGPRLTSTPIKPSRLSKEAHLQPCVSATTLASDICDDGAVQTSREISKNDWLRLREMQENTDRDMYIRVLKPKPQNLENPYEHLAKQQMQMQDPVYSSLDQAGKFVRACPQRNTYCGAIRDQRTRRQGISSALEEQQQENPPRCQSATSGVYRGYSKDTLGLNHKNSLQRNTPAYASGNTISREEIIEKVKQFCRNSMRRKSQQNSELSAVSYTSVEAHSPASNENGEAAPQMPQRIKSLPRNVRLDQQVVITPPIYQNLFKRSSMQSNSTDLPQRPVLDKVQYRRSEQLAAKNNVRNRTLRVLEPGSSESMCLVDGNNRNYIRNVPYVWQSGQNYGRNTPLILAGPNQLHSQIYRPQHNGSRSQYNFNDPRSIEMNPRLMQNLSRSMNFRPELANQRLEEPHLMRQQQPLQIYPIDLNAATASGQNCVAIEEKLQCMEENENRQEDWQNENKSGRQQTNDQVNEERRRTSRREDPRRHTLGGDMLQYGVMQGQPQQRAMDLENQPIRSYAPINQGPLFDDDPGIMSEVETASTGFRRGGKQRSSLPVVRTPSKTLERPLGLVFLQYRSETKRALLPNEITSIDTVRALFVRSFPRQLTMVYLEGPNVKIYIHDASKDMFYELEDVRSHLREIRDRSVLRLFESNEVAAPPQALPGGTGIPQPLPQAVPMHWDQDQSYFSEPEFDSEYQHQHIHKSKPGKQPPYYVGASQTLPRGMYSDRNKVPMDGYTSSPERGTRGSYEEPYYSQYGTRGNIVAPIIDEENSEIAMSEDQYALYGMKVGPGRIPRTANQMYDPTRPEDLHRIRVEHMERQLANLTGLVQKALVNQNPQIPQPAAPALNPNYLGVPAQCRERDRLKPPPPPKPIALTQTHSSYRADIALAPEVYNHLRGLQKKAKDLRMEVRTLRRLSQAQAVAVREDIKDAFMRIRATLLASSGSYWDQQGDQEKTRISREEELYKQEIIRLEKDLSDLESSVEGLRGEVINRRTRVNMSAVEDMALVLSRASKTVAELKMRFPSLSNGIRNILSNEMEKVVREEKFLKEEPDRLESALRRCKKLTGTLVTLKRLASVQEQRLPPNEPPVNEDPPRSAEISAANKQPVPTPRMGSIAISGGIAPENALDALLDELQTFAKPLNQNNDFRPDDSTSDDSSQAILSTVTTQIPQACLYNPNDPNNPNTALQQAQALQDPTTITTTTAQLNHGTNMTNNANMLQVNSNVGSLRRLHSYPSGSDTDTSPPQPVRLLGKPPAPERNAELLSKVGNKRIPPPPPPRTSSRSPLASPTSPNVPHRMPSLSETEPLVGNGAPNSVAASAAQDGSGNSSGNESGNDQAQRQVALERRHQELLRKQKMLQEQYQRLQQMSKTSSVAMPPPPADIMQLKKTGSESNLPQKMGLCMATATGSMKNLNSEVNASAACAGTVLEKNEKNLNTSNIQLVKQQLMEASSQLPKHETLCNAGNATVGMGTVTGFGTEPMLHSSSTTIKQVYETEIL